VVAADSAYRFRMPMRFPPAPASLEPKAVLIADPRFED
jgi:hypothetical protein